MPVTFKPEISIGTILQIAMLIVSGILFINRVSTKQTEILQELRTDHARWERVEKYLSSRDSHYWEIIRHFDELQPASEVREPSPSFATP
jgi:hypothetical protein